MSTDETPEETFAANAYCSYFMLLAYFYFHHVLNKIPAWKLFTLTLIEKSKAERSRWVKKTKKLCCNAMLLPGNLDLLSQTLEGSVVALVCGFIRRELVSKSRDGASFKKSTRKSRAIKGNEIMIMKIIPPLSANL